MSTIPIRFQPLILYTPAFLLGQYINSQILLAAIAAHFLLCLYSKKLHRQLLVALPILIGALTTYDWRISAPESEIGDGYHFFHGIVGQDLRRRRVGGIEFPFVVYKKREGFEWRTLNSPRWVSCLGKDLPWRNEYDLFPGSQRVLLAKIISLGKRSYDQKLKRDGYVARCKVQTISASIDGHPDMLTRLRTYLKSYLKSILGDNETTALLRSLLLGDRDAVSRREMRIFQRLGLAHILVVSGYHLGIIFGGSYLLFYFLTCGAVRSGFLLSAHEIAAALSYVVTIYFFLLCGFQPSLIRAFIALSLLFLSSFVTGRLLPLGSILLSLLALSVLWPHALGEPGIQLTYAALMAIYYAGNFWNETHSIFIRFVITNLLIALFTGIVSLFWFGELSLIGAVMNCTIAPIIALVGCQFGIVALLLALSGIDSGGYILQVIWWILEWLRPFLEMLSEMPFVAIQL